MKAISAGQRKESFSGGGIWLKGDIAGLSLS